MAGLIAGYSDSESEADEAQQERSNAVSDDESDASSVASDDSATLRAKEAEVRLTQLEARRQDTVGSKPGASLLPSAASAFDEVDGPPTFLDPESTRPLAVSDQHGLPFRAPSAGPASTAWHGPKKRIPPGQEFDIARLAPQLPGSVPKQGADKRDVPAGAVIEAKAKRYKASDAPVYTEAQIALMGGNVVGTDDGVLGEGSAGVGPSAPGAARPPGLPSRSDRGPRTAALGVTEFLAKGVGGAQLPRKAQDRKDKEQLKRAAGQSTHAVWKSEAEMVLRQQYD